MYKLVHETRENKLREFRSRSVYIGYCSSNLDILDPIEKEKIYRFKKLIQYLKNKIYDLSISEILKIALKKSFYLDILHFSGKKEKYYAIDFFIASIKEIEDKKDFFYLNDFICYFENIQSQLKVKRGSQDDENKVRLMTIHKSKGMEFKVVIIPNLNYQFLSLKEKSLYHPIFGFFLYSYYLNPIDFVEKEDLYSDFLKNLSKKETIAEFKRLFYVGITRAKQKIIFSSLIKDRIMNEKKFSKNFLYHMKNLNALYYLIKGLEMYDEIKKLTLSLKEKEKILSWNFIDIKIHIDYRLMNNRNFFNR